MGAYIRNIVIAAPDGTWVDDHWEGGHRALASFYAELLELAVVREDWPIVASDANSYPRLAFGDGPTPTYQAPRWGDPSRSQQVHLDFFARDIDAAAAHAVRLGATNLADAGDHRVFADPVGHPFCLYGAPAVTPGEALIDARPRVVIDCFSPRALAQFYAELLDLPERRVDSVERVELCASGGARPEIALQHSVFDPPRWPDPGYPQQIHLDVHADDAAAATRAAERLGAIRLPPMGGSCPVYADPAGHPFCLCSTGQ